MFTWKYIKLFLRNICMYVYIYIYIYSYTAIYIFTSNVRIHMMPNKCTHIYDARRAHLYVQAIFSDVTLFPDNIMFLDFRVLAKYQGSAQCQDSGGDISGLVATSRYSGQHIIRIQIKYKHSLKDKTWTSNINRHVKIMSFDQIFKI